MLKRGRSHVTDFTKNTRIEDHVIELRALGQQARYDGLNSRHVIQIQTLKMKSVLRHQRLIWLTSANANATK